MLNQIRFVVLLGSLRRGSYNRSVANSLGRLAPKSVTLTLLESVGSLPHYNGDLQASGMPASVAAMSKSIAAADALVIVTPEYNYSVPGVLKNALDWLSRVTPQPIAHKPVAIQTASPGRMGGVRAQYHLRQILVSLDAHVLNKPEVMITGVASKIDEGSGLLVDEETRKVVSAQLAALAEMVAK